MNIYPPKESTNISNRNRAKNDLAPEIMKDIFHFVEKPYNLRNNSTLKRRYNRSVYFGTETISSLAPKTWELAPNAILFNKEIKLWTTDKYLFRFRLCVLQVSITFDIDCNLYFAV